ncbi:MAG: LCP family protein [Defluviitaleaceae bacterium]|nr:LCP family protein [Defluviitaleaceae bacterium]
MGKTGKKIIALTSLTAIAVVVIAAAAVLSSGLNNGQNGNMGSLGNIIRGNSSGGGFSFGGSTQTLPDINFLILGLDDEAQLADVIMVGMLRGESGDLDILSIPRDTSVDVTPQLLDRFDSVGRRGHISYLSNFRLNEMRNRANRDAYGTQITIEYIEGLLGIEIDYYVTMRLSAFRYIVDAIGGVEMYIPQPGLRYIQGGTIDIDIPPGWQRLNGRQAEQVVRFRARPTADMFRIEMQQAFLTAFFSQIMNTEALMNDPLALFTTFATHIDTDLGGIAAAGYIGRGIIGALSLDNIDFHTAPGTPSTSRYFIDEAALGMLMRDIQNGTTRLPEPDDEETAE